MANTLITTVAWRSEAAIQESIRSGVATKDAMQGVLDWLRDLERRVAELEADWKISPEYRKGLKDRS